MSAGLPIITTNVGGIPEIIDDNITGLLVASKNPDQLAKKISRLADNKTLAEKLAGRAKTTVQQKFSKEKMAEQTMGVYKIRNLK